MYRKLVSTLDIESDLLKKLCNPSGINLLKYAEKANLEYATVKAIIRAIETRGIPIFREQSTHRIYLPKAKYLHRIQSELEAKVFTAKFGAISDLHLSSNYSQTPINDDLKRLFIRNEIKYLFIVGDNDEGSINMHRGQVYRQKKHGLTEKTDFLISVIPRIPGVTIYWIYGNHDLSHDNESGYKIMDHVSRERPDIITLGENEGRVNIGTKHAPFYIELSHPSIKPKSIKSTNIDKELEELDDEHRSHMYFRGHDHDEYTTQVKGTYGAKLPCLKGTDPYIRSMRMRSSIGGKIYTVSWTKQGTQDITDHTFLYHEISENNIRKWEIYNDLM